MLWVFSWHLDMWAESHTLGLHAGWDNGLVINLGE